MSYNPFVSVEKVLDTRAGSRRVIDFRHIKNFTSFSFTGSWTNTTGNEVVEGVQYKDLNVSGIKTNHLVFLVFNKNSDATLDKDNFPTCLVKEEGKIRVFARNSITVSNPSIAAILAVELEGPGLPSPLRGFTNGGGSGGSDEQLTLADITFDATTFISYLNQLGTVQSNIEGIQSFLDSLSYAITTGAVNADFIAANSITTEKLVINGPNKITDLDSFEQIGLTSLPGIKTTNIEANVISEDGSVSPFHGARLLRITSTAPSQSIVMHPSQNTNQGWIMLDPGNRYIFSCYIRGVSPARSGSFNILNNSGVALATGSFTSEVGTWKRFSVAFTAPSGSDIIPVTIRFNLPVEGTIYLDAMMLETASSPTATSPSSYQSGGSIIIDGGNIKANSLHVEKINTNSINTDFADIISANIRNLNANYITSGAINAEIIEVLNLNANNITAGEIDGKIIKSETIATDKFITKSRNLISIYDSFEGILGAEINGDSTNVSSAKVVNTTSFSGTNSLEIKPSSAGSVVKEIHGQSSKSWIRFYGAENFVFSFYIKSTTNISGTIELIDNNNILINKVPFTVTGGSPFARFSKTFNNTSETTSGYLVLKITSAAAGSSIYLDGIQLEDSDSAFPSEFASGNIRISGSNIIAGSISASDAIFQNAAIRAADIGSINADSIVSGSIKTDVIGLFSGEAEESSALRIKSDSIKIYEPVGSSDFMERIVIGRYLDSNNNSKYGVLIRNDFNQIVLDGSGLREEAFINEVIPSEAIKNISGEKVVGKGKLDGSVIAEKTIIADHLLTGTITAESGVIGSLNANVITTGKLSDYSGNSYFNLETGDFSLGNDRLKYDNSQGLLSLKHPESNASLELEASGIQFKDGSTPTASITGSEFNINYGRILTYLRVANHSIQNLIGSQGDSILAFRWVDEEVN